MTWKHSAPLKLDTNTLAADLKSFGVEVALGNIPRYSSEFVIGLNRNVGGTLEDVWGAGVNITLPTAGEQWEILSDDANDTFGGSGSQLMVLVYLDTNYDSQSEVIVMDGTTPVLTVATDIFRPTVLLTVASGANTANVGTIISRVAGGGATRNYVHPDFGFSFDGHFTIPRATTGLMVFCQVNAGRGDGIEFRMRVNIGPNPGNFGIVQYNNIFENAVNTDLPIPVTFSEKTDLIMSALNSGAGGTADCFTVCQVVLVEDET